MRGIYHDNPASGAAENLAALTIVPAIVDEFVNWP
jgi:hypothetical protein